MICYFPQYRFGLWPRGASFKAPQTICKPTAFL
jgi:hypothetical protein